MCTPNLDKIFDTNPTWGKLPRYHDGAESSRERVLVLEQMKRKTGGFLGVNEGKIGAVKTEHVKQHSCDFKRSSRKA